MLEEARKSAHANSRRSFLAGWMEDELRTPSLRTALIVVAFLLLLPGLGRVVSAQTPSPQPATEAAAASEAPASGTPRPVASRVLEGTAPTRTPEPTATPGLIVEGVSRVAERSGLAGESFLGLPAEDWLNLGIALLIVLAGYLVGTWLIRRILPPLVRRTATALDDLLLERAGAHLRWLVVIPVVAIYRPVAG